ncbi:helix-turn-helix transcriptional regulator [Sphaerisporangium sp. TRM90804]|uniref:helix-turn-helix domain-containing protein n=1 Tax=Sphaerisporangium sp. TRM90804 TaxID=3031113 RepID=UPI00244A77B4|nr:helix-turn-helix transcriptional regulator [Sphaerisporangium sp. TRM90804]MDH2427554.1 helix-turn-helix transcriptional regulator [Sphaerisporangium sp. TRM90804]
MGSPNLPIGERVRYWREKKQRKQAAVAGLCGITEEYLSQIERGLKVPSLPVLHSLAVELGVPMSALLGELNRSEPPARAADVDPHVVSALLGYRLPCGPEPTPTALLRDRVEAAWRMWQTSPTRFTDAAAVLPGLISDLERAVQAVRLGADDSARREVQRVAADLYFMLRSYCRRVGRVDLSLMAADRALRAAEEADDPIRIGAARWNLGHVLLASAEHEAAEQIAALGIRQLAQAAPEDANAVALAGALELIAVVADSRRKRWTKARDRLFTRATAQAQQAGEGNVMWTVFGPTNVELHSMSIDMEAGKAAEALRLADQIDASRLPSIERRFTFQLEVARCHDIRREDPAVLVHLLDLERLAPEDLTRSPLAQDIITRLRRRVRPTYRRQVNALAQRLQVP